MHKNLCNPRLTRGTGDWLEEPAPPVSKMSEGANRRPRDLRNRGSVQFSAVQGNGRLNVFVRNTAIWARVTGEAGQ